MFYSNSLDNKTREAIIKELSYNIREVTENAILEQLTDLVTRDLLVIEYATPVLVQEPHTNKVTMKQSVKLTLKDKEYIEKLEKDNQNLKEILSKIKEVFPGDKNDN